MLSSELNENRVLIVKSVPPLGSPITKSNTRAGVPTPSPTHLAQFQTRSLLSFRYLYIIHTKKKKVNEFSVASDLI